MAEPKRTKRMTTRAGERLDRVFFALSDPIRRKILMRLERADLLVSELAEPFSISLQAVSRHIVVLEKAGLIEKERTGRISRCRLEVGPIADAAVWINRYSKYWQAQSDLLASTLCDMADGSAEPPGRARREKNRAARHGTAASPRSASARRH